MNLSGSLKFAALWWAHQELTDTAVWTMDQHTDKKRYVALYIFGYKVAIDGITAFLNLTQKANGRRWEYAQILFDASCQVG